MIRTTAGMALLAMGGLVSILTFVHDWVRLGLPPQGAPKRVAPEFHLTASLLSATGAGILWGWRMGGLVCTGHFLLAFLVGRPLIERFAPQRRQDL
ncbi:MAG TPA: hypothetical protein VEN81_08390 [Planctomycetota bacterium]|nr:hypothetical protein [Planctomycetota bacterium]